MSTRGRLRRRTRLERTKGPGVCVVCGKPANTRVYHWQRLYTEETYRACGRYHADRYGMRATHPEATNILPMRPRWWATL